MVPVAVVMADQAALWWLWEGWLWWGRQEVAVMMLVRMVGAGW